MSQLNKQSFDVVVVGAGLVGASFALALDGCGLRVAVVEPAAPAQPGPQWDSRIYTLSPASVEFLRTLGAWDAIDAARIQRVERMEIFGDRPDARLGFSAYEAGVAQLAHVVESGRLQFALWRKLSESPAIELFAPARCATMAIDRDAQITLDDGRVLQARLVVGADGANSWVRRAANLTARAQSYHQLGVVANFAAERPHGATAFQWFRADGVLALLPLPDGNVSMVWSTPEAHAGELLALPADELCARVSAASGRALGRLTLLTEARGFPLQLMHAEATIAACVALIGDAAHVVHPLAGQGVNLGFGDAAELARALREREVFRDCGDVVVLRRYERARAEATLAMRGVTHGLQRLFGSTGAFPATVRNLGLNLTDRSSVLKTLLVRQALG